MKSKDSFNKAGVIISLSVIIGVLAVHAWTGPTGTAPANNVAAPINVSSVAQVKSGTFTAGGLITSGNITVPASGKIIAGGSETIYGALNIEGSKSGWSGISFKTLLGSNAGTLMMHPSYSGFFKASDTGWRWYVDESGNTLQDGDISSGRDIYAARNIDADGDICNGSGQCLSSASGGTSGSLCGFSIEQLGATTWSTAYCNGFAPSSSCPSGYTRANLFQGGAPAFTYYTLFWSCVKN